MIFMKPAIIIELEKKIGASLEAMSNTYNNGYLLDDKERIIVLNLSRLDIKDVGFLKDFIDLEELDISSNQIKDIIDLSHMTNLRRLSVSYNKIKEISGLSRCKNLEELNLQKNLITHLKDLKNLKGLKMLDASYNKLISTEGLEDMIEMKELYLSNNLISNIDSLSKLKKIKFISLANNMVIDIEPLLSIDNFKYFNLEFNSIQRPPMAIFKLGYNRILQWFDEIEKYQEEPLYEAKLLIVGEPNAGKTTLRKLLTIPNYQVKDGVIDETIGVYVDNNYSFRYAKNEKVFIKCNIWDFGGQEKQYPLHQYFLKDKSIYALLSSDREDNQYLDKWFSIIRLLSGNATEIVLVLNQKNRSSQSSNFNKTKYEMQGFKFKDFVLDLSKDKERIEELKSKIQNLVSDLPHIGELYPSYCKLIADKIDEKRFKESKDYLTYEEYESICLELNLIEDNVPNKALEYLSIIGKIIHYEDDHNLQRIIIINPHWLIDAIYGILTSVEIDEFHSKGKFDKNWLIKYLANKKTANRPNGYKESESLHILNLMLKNNFDICYNVGKNFLIPLCMPENLPENNFSNEGIKVLFKYEIMPSGMVARVLVRLNEFIEGDLISRTAGILSNSGNRAKIEEFYLNNDANRYIRIIVNGKKNTQKQFLDLIKREIIIVQKDWFENLQINELIPCICCECVNSNSPSLFEIEELKKWISKEKFFKECKISAADVNIFEMLGEVYDFGFNKKIENLTDFKEVIKMLKEDKFSLIIQFFGDNKEFKNLINMGDQFNISGDNPNSQFGGKNNTQNNYHNQYQDNKIVNEIKDILNDLKTSEQINEDWRKNFTDAYVEMSKLEEAEEKEVETKSISKLQKFFTKAKEIKDWVAIGVLPAEIATKGGKMIELGQELLKLFVK